jgi:hypothetical protein
MSILFRKQEALTIAQLTRSWAPEVSNAGQRDESIQDLGHILVTDILNGRLDDSGPFRKDQCSGLRLITPDNRAGIIKGSDVHSLLRSLPVSWAIHHILVTKEAVLDFATRRQIPPPSWWTDSTSVLPDAGVTTKDTQSTAASPIAAPTHSARPRGRKPKKLNQVNEAIRGDIQLGRLSRDDLRNMTEKALANRYGVSRDTARKARDAILSEMPGRAGRP